MSINIFLSGSVNNGRLSTGLCQGHCRRRDKGFTLLEALIGFLILSIGMLGIASLQAISLKAGKTSVYGTIANMKVEELFESMRVNPTALASYTGPGVNNNCSGSTLCTPAKLAEEDVYWWKKDLQAGLPNAASTTSSVTVTPAVPPSKMATVTVAVNWKERNKNAAGSVSKTYSTTANICTGVPC